MQGGGPQWTSEIWYGPGDTTGFPYAPKLSAINLQICPNAQLSIAALRTSMSKILNIEHPCQCMSKASASVALLQQARQHR